MPSGTSSTAATSPRQRGSRCSARRRASPAERRVRVPERRRAPDRRSSPGRPRRRADPPRDDRGLLMRNVLAPKEDEFLAWVDDGYPGSPPETVEFLEEVLDPTREARLWPGQRAGLLRAIYAFEVMGKRTCCSTSSPAAARRRSSPPALPGSAERTTYGRSYSSARTQSSATASAPISKGRRCSTTSSCSRRSNPT